MVKEPKIRVSEKVRDRIKEKQETIKAKRMDEVIVKGLNALDKMPYLKRLEKENKRLKESSAVQEETRPSLTESTQRPEEKKEAPPCYYAVLQADGKIIRCQNASKKVKAWQPRNRLITIEDCWGCWNRRKHFVKQPSPPSPSLAEKPETPSKPAIVSPKFERSLEEIVDEVGVCANPILMRQRPLLCVLCQKRNYAKWQACQEIQKELKNPVKLHKFINAQAQQRKNPSPMEEITAQTQKMSIQKIEAELVIRRQLYSVNLLAESSEPETIDEAIEKSFQKILDESPPLFTKTTEQPIEDAIFDARNKHFHEVCENCEELRNNRCTHYCREFLDGLPEDKV